MSSILKVKDLKIENIKFSDPKDSKNSTKIVFVNGGGKNSKILLQTPKMYAPFGISKWDDGNDLNSRFSLLLKFSNDDKDILLFKEKMEQLDETVKEYVLENHKLFFPNVKKFDKTKLEEIYYKPIVKQSASKIDKNGNPTNYPPNMNVKIDRGTDPNGYTGKFVYDKKNIPNNEVLFYDKNKKKLECDESNYEHMVVKGSNVVCLIELSYISFTKMGVSVKWKLVQMKVYNDKNVIDDYMIDDEESNDEINEESNEDQSKNIIEEYEEYEDYE